MTGFEFGHNSQAVAAVLTDKGRVECDFVAVGAGPWVRDFWSMLDLPKTVSIKGRDGAVHRDIPMWRYWQLEEGVLGVEPDCLKTNDGRMPPVIHVDTDAPLYSDRTGELITDELWGVYYKPDFHFDGVQGGAMPYKVRDSRRRGRDRSLWPGQPGIRGVGRLRRHVELGAGLLP